MVKKLLLLVASSVLTLTLAEVIVRSLPSDVLGFTYIDSVFRTPREFVPDTNNNSLGYHDRDPMSTNAIDRRVILLGDSYVAARSVPLDHTVGQQLEDALNAPGLERFDVVSLGRGGWGQKLQLDALKSVGSDLSPDLVITLFFPFNDVADGDAILRRKRRRQLRQIQEQRPGWVNLRRKHAPLLLLERSVLNQMVSHRLARFRWRSSDLIPVDYEVYINPLSDRWQNAWRITHELFRATRNQSHSVDARYGIVLASSPHGVLDPEDARSLIIRSYPAMGACQLDLDAPARQTLQIAHSEGIQTLDLEPHFREVTSAGARLHWRFDGHWNREGNAMAGQRMASMVRALLELPPVKYPSDALESSMDSQK